MWTRGIWPSLGPCCMTAPQDRLDHLQTVVQVPEPPAPGPSPLCGSALYPHDARCEPRQSPCSGASPRLLPVLCTANHTGSVTLAPCLAPTRALPEPTAAHREQPCIVGPGHVTLGSATVALVLPEAAIPTWPWVQSEGWNSMGCPTAALNAQSGHECIWGSERTPHA